MLPDAKAGPLIEFRRSRTVEAGVRQILRLVPPAAPASARGHGRRWRAIQFGDTISRPTQTGAERSRKVKVRVVMFAPKAIPRGARHQSARLPCARWRRRSCGRIIPVDWRLMRKVVGHGAGTARGLCATGPSKYATDDRLVGSSDGKWTIAPVRNVSVVVWYCFSPMIKNDLIKFGSGSTGLWVVASCHLGQHLALGKPTSR